MLSMVPSLFRPW